MPKIRVKNRAGAKINWKHPLAKDLCYYVMFGSANERDLVSGAPMLVNNGSKSVITNRGPARQFVSSGDYLTMQVPQTLKKVHVQKGITVLCIGNLQVSGNFKHPFTLYQAGSTHFIDCSTNSMADSAVTETNDFPTTMSCTNPVFTVGDWAFFGMKFTGGGTPYVGLFNNVITNVSSFGGRPTLDSVDTIIIGNYEPGFGNTFQGYIEQFLIFSRELTDVEYIKLYNNLKNNPEYLLLPDDPIVGAAAGGAAFTQTLTENQTHTDALTKLVSKLFAENNLMADSVSKQVGKNLTDNSTFTDTVLKQISKVLTESQTITDSLIKSLSRSLNENQTYVDTVTNLKVFVRTLTDSFTNSDTLIRLTGKVLTETITAIDTVKRFLSKTITDTQTIVDTVTKMISKTFTENVAWLDFLTTVLNPVIGGLTNIKVYILKRVFKNNYTLKDSKKDFTIKLKK